MARCGTFLKDEPVIFSPPKAQQVFLTKSVFGKPELVKKITTSSKASHREKPNINQER